MKIKYFFLLILFTLLGISISQIFSIFPFPEDLFSFYRSGYFNELDKNYKIITDSFLSVKMNSTKATYGWVYLDDLQKKHGLQVDVYNPEGYKVPVDGATTTRGGKKILSLLADRDNDFYSEIDGEFYSAIYTPVYEKKCIICHRGSKKGEKSGALTFKRKFDSHIYYTSERTIIFVTLSLFISILLFIVLRWDPDRSVKDLFNK